MGIFGGMNRWARPDELEWQAAQQMQQPPQQQPMPEPQREVPKQGFWNGGEKFGGRDALAALFSAISDAAAYSGGRQGGAVSALSNSRLSAIDMARQAQAAEAARATAMQDYRAKKGIDAEFDKPKPHHWESNDGSLMELGPDGVPRVRYKDPTPRFQWISDGMGGGRMEPIPGTGVGAGTPLPTFSDDDWNGAGGGAGNGTGGFRRPYR